MCVCVCLCTWVSVSVGGGPWSVLTRAIKVYRHEAHLSIMLTGWPRPTPLLSEPQETSEKPDPALSGLGWVTPGRMKTWGERNKHLMIQGMFRGENGSCYPAFVSGPLKPTSFPGTLHKHLGGKFWTVTQFDGTSLHLEAWKPPM